MDARIAESNAFNGTVMGTRMFCHTFGGVGYKVCQAAFDELTPITPGESDGIKESPCLAEIGRVAPPHPPATSRWASTTIQRRPP